MKKLFTILVAAFAALAVNAQSVDLQVPGFMDNTTDQNMITELNLSMTDGFNPYVVIMNAGPDNLPETDTLGIIISVFGQPMTGMMGFTDLEVGSGVIFSAQSDILSADEMDQYGIQGTFEVCYTVEIYSTGNTTDPDMSNNQACLTVNRGVGIEENTSVAGINVYPNPATSVLNVVANGDNKVEIVNVLGQVVYSSNMTDNAQINVSNLNNGVYFVRLNGTATQKFIKK